MIYQIKCSVCDSVMGTLEKPAITERDIEDYAAMMTCENGHSSSVLSPPEAE